MESSSNSIDANLIEEFWSRRAKEEDNRWTPEPFLKFEIGKVSELLTEDKKLSILDLGSGSGTLSRNLTNPNDTLTAVDFESSFQRFFTHDSRFSFVNCRVDKFLSPEKYDLILLFGVVTHLNLTEENVTYKNISSMISRDGILVVKNQCSDTEEFIFNGFSSDLGVNYSARYPSRHEQRNRLLEHFMEVEILEYPSWSKKHRNTTHLMFICRKGRPQ